MKTTAKKSAAKKVTKKITKKAPAKKVAAAPVETLSPVKPWSESLLKAQKARRQDMIRYKQHLAKATTPEEVEKIRELFKVGQRKAKAVEEAIVEKLAPVATPAPAAPAIKPAQHIDELTASTRAELIDKAIEFLRAARV